MIIPVHEINYQTLGIYMLGYIDGIGLIANKNLGKEITIWFRNKIDREMSVCWIDYIPFYYKNKTEDELKLIMIDITEQYFKENLNWYNEPQCEK